jgi:hypothetical protein
MTILDYQPSDSLRLARTDGTWIHNLSDDGWDGWKLECEYKIVWEDRNVFSIQVVKAALITGLGVSNLRVDDIPHDRLEEIEEAIHDDEMWRVDEP